MFPTTIWTTIRKAGDDDPESLQQFAENYRPPVLFFIRSRGFSDAEAQDLCQDVFVRLLKGKVLSKADMNRGRFRSLLLAVTTHVIQDRLRKRTETPVAEVPDTGVEPEEDDAFDRAWVVHLAEQAMARLRVESPTYHAILKNHILGEKQDRNKLWIARGKLSSLIRAGIAQTCSSHAEFEQEVAYLAHYLRPGRAEQDSTSGTKNTS